MKYLHYNIISSTSEYTRHILHNEDEVIVTADFQTAGRGRNQNSWLGNYGDNIYLSYGINHKTPVNFYQAALYQAIGCLSVLSALKLSIGQEVRDSGIGGRELRNISANLKPQTQNPISQCIFKIKYPNDIYACVLEQVLDNNKSEIYSKNPVPQSPISFSNCYKKISGVLTEHGFLGDKCNYSILGIGINVNQVEFPEELKEKATSLKLLNLSVDLNKLINLLTEEILFFKKLNFKDIFELWLNELNIINKTVSIKNKPGYWIINEILPDSRLLVTKNDTNEQLIIENGDSICYNL